MNDFYEFTKKILNLRDNNAINTIKNITIEERNKIYQYTNDLTGYCKYLASQIEARLKDENIYTYYIDLNNIININHVVLIAEYMHNNEIKRILIDPTYHQFAKKENQILINLENWPSEKLEKETLNKLLEDGIVEVNDNIFNNYLNSFKKINNKISLDNYLLNHKIKSR